MNALWDLLPPAVATRAKAIVAAIGGIAFVVVTLYPRVSANHWVAGVIAVLTVLGVYTAPNENAKSRIAAVRNRDPRRRSYS